MGGSGWGIKNTITINELSFPDATDPGYMKLAGEWFLHGTLSSDLIS